MQINYTVLLWCLLQVQIQVQRTRKHFGAPIEFQDRNVADAKDCYVECQKFDDKTFDLKRVELTKGVQVREKQWWWWCLKV